MKRLCLTLVSALCVVSSTFAQSDSLENITPKRKNNYWNNLIHGNEDRSFERLIDFSFMVLPSYTREGSFGIGGAASGLYRLDKRDSLMQPSNITIAANASLEGFYTLTFFGNNNFKGRRSRLIYNVSLNSKNMEFWGITYDACAVNPVINYTRRQIRIDADYVYELKKHFYIGATLRFNNSNISKIDNISYLEGQKNAYTFTGLGLLLQYDSRDFIPNPKRGVYIMFRETAYPQWLGSYNRSLWRTTFIADYYQQVWKGGVLAFDLYGQFNSDNSPWAMREELGTTFRMRGYYLGRYTDNNIATFQVELRQQIVRRFGFAAWVGTGTVFPNFNDFKIKNLLPNYGVGLRWEFKHNVNLRIDYGFGKDTGGIVFNISEAF